MSSSRHCQQARYRRSESRKGVVVSTLLCGPERLAELDLSVELLSDVLLRADAGIGDCTPLDPPIMAGLLRWGLTTRLLREQLVSAGWSYDNPRNLARTIHPSGAFAVIVTTGDESTARAEREPGPRHPKGYATELAVLTNGQLAFDFGELTRLDIDNRTTALQPRTWFLLFHVDANAIHAELSIPEGFVGGRMTEWSERILLPAIPRWTTLAGASRRLINLRH